VGACATLLSWGGVQEAALLTLVGDCCLLRRSVAIVDVVVVGMGAGWSQQTRNNPCAGSPAPQKRTAYVPAS